MSNGKLFGVAHCPNFMGWHNYKVASHVEVWWLLKMKNLGIFGLTFICMGNAIRFKKNTSKTVFNQSIPLE